MDVIFEKTPKGISEMEARSGELTPRMRRILILVDGRRSVEDLRAMSLAEDLTRTLGLLEEGGYIVGRVVEAVANDGGDDAEAAVVFRQLPDPPDPQDLEMARNFIVNTLRTFCGPMSHIGIVEAAFKARTHDELRTVFGPWSRAIAEVRDGRRRAEELRKRLLNVI